MVVMMGGIVTSQWLIAKGDVAWLRGLHRPLDLVSPQLRPVLLSATQAAPVYSATKPLAMRRLVAASPLPAWGMFLSGLGLLRRSSACRRSMGPARGSRRRTSPGWCPSPISRRCGAGPIGWLSDRMDRRVLILALAALGGGVALLAIAADATLADPRGCGGGGGNLEPALCAAHRLCQRLPGARGHGRGLGGLAVHQRVGAIAGPLAVGWA
jgi:hypothetical protein